jgi:protoheme IX farnesyltransferase
MLPTGKRDKGTALQTIIYTVWTVLISIVPVFGFTGRLQLSVIAMILTLGVGFWFLYYGFKLFKNQTDKAARQLMLSSVVYITVIQIIYVLDKFIRLWI